MPKMIDEANIFRTVIQMFISLGYHGTTTKEIAKLTGINEATLFRKYRNKLNLVKRAFDYEFSIVPLSKIFYTGDLQTDLVAILEAYVVTNEVLGEIMPMILLEIPRFPELKSVLKTAFVNVDRLVSIIDRYQKEGQLKKESPLLSANILLSPILFNKMFQRANIDLPTTSIDLHEYINMFLSGRQKI